MPDFMALQAIGAGIWSDNLTQNSGQIRARWPKSMFPAEGQIPQQPVKPIPEPVSAHAT